MTNRLFNLYVKCEFLDAIADQALVKQIVLPDNIILHNEIAGWPLQSKATKPKRKFWYAKVLFDDSTLASDHEHYVFTKITYWEKDVSGGVNLGQIGQFGLEGNFRAAFSDEEIADLKAGKSWLTLTVGNYVTEAKRDHPKLSIEKLALDKQIVQPVKIGKPKFYYGRILFEDGSPPILEPAPWPSAEIRVNFPYAGSFPTVDSNGYFKVYFTKQQYETAKTKKARKNIMIPDYDSKNRSTGMFIFPVSKLSQKKEEAGVVRIPEPSPNENH